MVFLNPSTQPSRPAVYFYDTEGNPIAAESVVDITGDLEITEDGGLTIQTKMEPLGVLTIATRGRGEPVTGSVRVVSDGPIGGLLRFEHPGVGAGVVGASLPISDAIFPVRRQEGDLSTAAAIRNLGEEAMEVSCQLMSGGIVLEEAEIPLEANGQEARYIEELFPRTDTSDFVGSVRCTGPGRFTGVAVELDAGNRIFTTLPVVPARTGGKRPPASGAARRGLAASDERTPGRGQRTQEASASKLRVLVDPDSLKVIDPNGRVVGSSTGGGPPRRRGSGLVEPHERSPIPQNKVPLRGYSDLDRENVGLQLARMVLSSDREDIVDLRTQCGVGADAMDKLGRFYELKVSAGGEPSYVTLTNAELQRARSSPHFFLVVVSGVEGADARPTVRIIPRPLDQLEENVSGTMTLSGVREAKSVTYDFAPLDELVPDGNEDHLATATD